MRKDDDLRAEYLLLQGMYEDFDKRALSLKALAAPLLGAGVIVGLKDGSVAIHAAVVAVACSLWLLETIWKAFQYALTGRIETLEAWYRGEGADAAPAPFQVYTEWNRAWRLWYGHPRHCGRIARQPFVALPYAVIVLAAAAAMLAGAVR